jgi:hypothetical protein
MDLRHLQHHNTVRTGQHSRYLGVGCLHQVRLELLGSECHCGGWTSCRNLHNHHHENWIGQGRDHRSLARRHIQCSERHIHAGEEAYS